MGERQHREVRDVEEGRPDRNDVAPLDSDIGRFHAFLEALPDEAWMKDLAGRYLMTNERFARSVSRSREELIGHTDGEVFGADLATPFLEFDRQVVEEGRRSVREHWGIDPRNWERRYETIRSPVTNLDGDMVAFVGISRDVTERAQREELLREAERRYRRLVETLPDGVFVTGLDGRVRETNATLCQMLGRPASEVEGHLFLDFVAPRSRDYTIQRFQERTQDPTAPSTIELWIQRPTGEERRVEARSTLIIEDGDPQGTHGVVRDVTEIRWREEAERRMLDVLEATPDIVAIRSRDGELLYSNRTARDWIGTAAAGAARTDVLTVAHPDWAAALVDDVGIPTALEEGSWSGETAIFDHDGREVPISQVIVAGRDESGAVTHVSTIMRDISAIKAREEALRRRDAILEAVGRAGTVFLRHAEWQHGAGPGLARLGDATDVSRLSVLRLERKRNGNYHASLVHEWTADGVPAMLEEGLLEDVSADEAGMTRWIHEFEHGRAVAGPVSALPPEERALMERQGIRSVAAVPVHVHDELWGMLVFDDCVRAREWAPTEIDALRAAAGALGAAVQRRLTEEELADREEELRQSQKMEAVGRLAGGVAHDFNNMLTAIQGFATLLRSEVGPGGRSHEYLDEILRAADRSTALTRQLLAFSRKQVMHPQVVDLNAIVREMESMLRHLLGETIALSTALACDLDPVRVDSGQIEQVIMNLAVNALDAMPGGGQLEIGTRNVHVDGEELFTIDGALGDGDHVAIFVTDSGVGMAPEVRERIFEPFFTTKPTGEGTGLGLATVYGIVSQSEGSIAVDSEPGGGTTFRIYFPRTVPADGAAVESPPPRTTQEAEPRAGTVLIVEDELAVRRLIARVLEKAGYSVLTAGSGLEALAAMRDHGRPIDLLLTDVVMPDMGGPELAETLRNEHVDLRVCFMSGYTENEVFRHGLETKDEAFLEKPFAPDALRALVGSILSRDE